MDGLQVLFSTQKKRIANAILALISNRRLESFNFYSRKRQKNRDKKNKNYSSTFLSVPGGELVPDLWDSHGPDPNLDELVSIRVEGDHDLVHDTGLGVTQEGRGVSLCESGGKKRTKKDCWSD